MEKISEEELAEKVNSHTKEINEEIKKFVLDRKSKFESPVAKLKQIIK
jgi:hypothetical protein